MVPRLRIFLSSPTDVNWERLRAHLVIRRLALEYQRYFIIEPFLWEHEPMLASQHFQDAIDPPGNYDIVILMVWSRLGTPLPEKTAVREYHGIDDRVPVTGTEWEFENALKAHRAGGTPDILAYRRTGGVVASVEDAARREETIRQYEALEGFWERWFAGDTGFLAGFSTYRDPETFEHRLESDLRTLIERRIRDRQAAPAAAVWLKSSPFRGLRAYDFDDTPVFFGRHAEIGAGLTRLLEASEQGTAFLLVTGPSGSGKSSLARAGLLPSLCAPKTVAAVGLWRRVVLRPGDAGGDPLLALARALAPEHAPPGEGLPELLGAHMDAAELAANLAAGGDPAFLFGKTLRDLAAAERNRSGLLPHEEARLVLLIDQLEELATRPEITPEQRSCFARTLAALARSGVVWVIATVRSDLWHLLESIPELRDLAEHGARLALAAPDSAQLLEIIRKPAQAAGLSFDTEPDSQLPLDAVLAREAEAQPGVLPLLSVMLDELYERDVASGAGSSLTVATYRALGGLHAAIGQRAESRLQEIQKTDPAAAAALPRVLRTLVTVTAQGDAPAARSAPLTSFPEASPERRLVDVLIAPGARLLTAEDRGHGPEVRLAHEALIGHWPRAQAIIAENRELIRVRDEIDAQRRRWEAAGRRPELLLAAGLPLNEARDLTQKLGDELPAELLEFIKASRRRAAGRWQLAAGAAAVVLLAALGVWDRYFRVKTQYCASYSERWAVPYCIGPLNAAQQAARYESYRFRAQGGRVLELALVNGSGQPRAAGNLSLQDEPWNIGAALWRYSYVSGTPLLNSVVMEAPNGAFLRRVSYQYSDDRRQAFAVFDGGFGVDEGQTGAGSRLGIAAFGTSSTSAPQRSAIRRHRLSFDAQGRLLRRDFLLAAGTATAADALGSYGRAYDYDSAGLLTRRRNLDGQGNTLVDKWGIAEQALGYDQQDDLVNLSWLGRDGHLHANEQNFARLVCTQDGAGNCIAEAFYTPRGELIARTDVGYARVTSLYDAHGNISEQRFFDAAGRPVLSKDQGVARITGRYDARGNAIEAAYFGLRGEPVLDKVGGVHRWTAQYDPRGNLVQQAFFGINGRPILSKDLGAARLNRRYDEHGNIVEVAYFGPDGKATLSKQGIARLTRRYENNKLTEEASFDADGKLIVSKLGYARMTNRYDDRGNRIEYAYLDADGRATANSNGIARVTFGYDQRGNEIEAAFFGADGHPLVGRGNFAAAKYQYDERGNQIQVDHLGVDGKPAADSSGIARAIYRYDARGNKVEEAYFGVDGSPTAGTEGYARIRYQYDERGNMSQWDKFGLDGKPKADSHGVARTIWHYDERGNKTEEAYFDATGMPTSGALGYARVTLQYDETGNLIQEDLFGADGRPALDRAAGVARLVQRFDPRGNVLELSYFGVDGKPILLKDKGVARVTRAYDERDHEIEERYFGVHNEPVPDSSGTARGTLRYDGRGNIVEADRFGIDDAHPVHAAARLLLEYDAQDRLTTETRLDPLGQPALLKLGQDEIRVAQRRHSYNAANEEVDVAYLDEHGARIPIEVEIKDVPPFSAAARLGLAKGDRVLRYDGNALQSVAQWKVTVAHAAPGNHRLTLRRSGKPMELDVPQGGLGAEVEDVPATSQAAATQPAASHPKTAGSTRAGRKPALTGHKRPPHHKTASLQSSRRVHCA